MPLSNIFGSTMSNLVEIKYPKVVGTKTDLGTKYSTKLCLFLALKLATFWCISLNLQRL